MSGASAPLPLWVPPMTKKNIDDKALKMPWKNAEVADGKVLTNDSGGGVDDVSDMGGFFVP
jgi:hypothetical protein